MATASCQQSAYEKKTRACYIVQLECRWSHWRYLMCVRSPVSMLKLGSLRIIVGKSGVGLKICRCARFFMAWPYLLSSFLEKSSRHNIGNYQTFLDISILGKTLTLNFDFFNLFTLSAIYPTVQQLTEIIWWCSQNVTLNGRYGENRYAAQCTVQGRVENIEHPSLRNKLPGLNLVVSLTFE